MEQHCLAVSQLSGWIRTGKLEEARSPTKNNSIHCFVSTSLGKSGANVCIISTRFAPPSVANSPLLAPGVKISCCWCLHHRAHFSTSSTELDEISRWFEFFQPALCQSSVCSRPETADEGGSDLATPLCIETLPVDRCPRVLCQLGCGRRRDWGPGGWCRRCRRRPPSWKSTGTIGRGPLPRISSPLLPVGKT